ncbi:dehydrogenase [Paenibacillus popilliae ATCC 14706]|uniref:Dehydrogenase n=1 Tax=Paenibacillus popilliae ATCC 14706 TaxID=1212764 RepID=M9LJB4_PAEPP|nr:dehydrogenase [Paenibacillus popilliae ATCC 14706]
MRPSQHSNPITEIAYSKPANEEHGEQASSENDKKIISPAPHDETGISPELSFSLHQAGRQDDKVQRANHPEPSSLLVMNGFAVKTENNSDTAKYKFRQ